MDARLRVLGGPCSGKTVSVPRGKLLIGRAEDCDLRLSSEFVSAHHSVLLLDDYTLRIRDLGSKNGTYVNGRQIGTRVIILVHEDTIAIGELNVLVDLTPAKPESEPAGPSGRSDASLAALQGTGMFDGDTLRAKMPLINPEPLSTELPTPAPILPDAVPQSNQRQGQEPSNG